VPESTVDQPVAVCFCTDGFTLAIESSAYGSRSTENS
jgi:hypothetical protein